MCSVYLFKQANEYLLSINTLIRKHTIIWLLQKTGHKIPVGESRNYGHSPSFVLGKSFKILIMMPLCAFGDYKLKFKDYNHSAYI